MFVIAVFVIILALYGAISAEITWGEAIAYIAMCVIVVPVPFFLPNNLAFVVPLILVFLIILAIVLLFRCSLVGA